MLATYVTTAVLQLYAQATTVSAPLVHCWCCPATGRTQSPNQHASRRMSRERNMATIVCIVSGRCGRNLKCAAAPPPTSVSPFRARSRGRAARVEGPLGSHAGSPGEPRASWVPPRSRLHAMLHARRRVVVVGLNLRRACCTWRWQRAIGRSPRVQVAPSPPSALAAATTAAREDALWQRSRPEITRGRRKCIGRCSLRPSRTC